MPSRRAMEPHPPGEPCHVGGPHPAFDSLKFWPQVIRNNKNTTHNIYHLLTNTSEFGLLELDWDKGGHLLVTITFIAF
ncbi:hypothetical protein I79_018772 [Cricetulus griseus]|uniref:Uncharacterized protein n=1 Tax=Cricetulus griseus TaxID=10029 RepID=G3I5L9_CRIGR|nr:hypothetical protein I79_018772 [Cricetulus griseus]